MSNHFQALVDGMSAQWQRERSGSQMTLGSLIAALEAMPAGAEVSNLRRLDSYRGYYSDLALEHADGNRPAAELLAECRAAMGEVFHGYKGGEYVMGARTPMWIADYGNCGVALMAVMCGCGIETRDDDE
jgi:hypothetical protein